MKQLLALAALMIFSSLQSGPVEVHLYLHGLDGVKGKMIIYVFDNPEDFPVHKDRAKLHRIVDPHTPQPYVFHLPPGAYAFAVYVDSNGNGRIDRNWLGIPDEPYALSGNPHFHFGPPRFDECKVQVRGPVFRLDLEIED